MLMTTHNLIAYLMASTGLALSTVGAFAQPKKRQYAFGIQAGSMVYQGDLNPSRLGSLKTMQPSLGLHAAMLMGANMAIRAGGHLRKTQRNRKQICPTGISTGSQFLLHLSRHRAVRKHRLESSRKAVRRQKDHPVPFSRIGVVDAEGSCRSVSHDR